MCSAINTKTRIILLSCGSFNPITHMHLRLFELARDYLHNTGRFQVVGGIISPVNDGYKKKDLIPAKHRCEMVEHALKSNDWVKLDCWESDQESWSPTVKVLEYHQNILNSITNTNNIQISASKKQKLDVENMNAVNNNKQTKDWDLSQPVHLMLLCGGDLLESFNVPDLWAFADIARIVGKFGLAVVTRSGSNPQKFVYESDILSKFQNNIHIITEWIPNDISSTNIRRALRRGNSVKYLIPDAVLHYIKEHGLYSSNKMEDAIRMEIMKVLPSLEENNVKVLLECLVDLGVTNSSDLRLVKEGDLKDVLKIVQVRQLIASWKKNGR